MIGKTIDKVMEKVVAFFIGDWKDPVISDVKFHQGGVIHGDGKGTPLPLAEDVKFNYGGMIHQGNIEKIQMLPGEKILIKDGDEYTVDEHFTGSIEEIEKILKGKAVRKMDVNRNESGNKYLRKIILKAPPVKVGEHWVGVVDVYSVLDAFKVICPAIAHAVKKLLCPGTRGKGCGLQDISESKDAIIRAYDLALARIAMEQDEKTRFKEDCQDETEDWGKEKWPS